MTADFITVGKSGPEPEEDIADGAYPLILIDIADPETVDTPGGQYGDSWTFRRWTFKVNQTGSPYDGRKVEAALSLNSGKKSNTYGFLTALNGGVEPQTNQKFGRDELIGRMAIGRIYHKDQGGWPKVHSLQAIPAGMLQQQFAQATQAPVNTTASQAVAPAEVPGTALPNMVAPTDDLPF